MGTEQWDLHQPTTKLMFLFHVGNGKWESQKQENFLVQNVKFQNG